MRTIIPLSVVLLALTACQGEGEPDGIGTAEQALSGQGEMQDWTSSGIADGTTTIEPASGSSASTRFSYAVDLGYQPGIGLSYRTAEFSTTADASAEISFDWDYTFNHADWYLVADCWVFADSPSGTQLVQLVDHYASGWDGRPGEWTFEGSATITVEEGYDFGFIVGGSNFDANAYMNGSLTITWDNDGDGVSNQADECPSTSAEAVVDASGCSIAQLSPCDHAWKNHGAYVSSVAHTADDFLAAGLISEAERDATVSAAAQSDCGAKE